MISMNDDGNKILRRLQKESIEESMEIKNNSDEITVYDELVNYLIKKIEDDIKKALISNKKYADIYKCRKNSPQYNMLMKSIDNEVPIFAVLKKEYPPPFKFTCIYDDTDIVQVRILWGKNDVGCKDICVII